MNAERIKIYLDGQIELVEQSYLAQSGKAPMCQLDKDGRATSELKYDEGRLVALQAARRHMKQMLTLSDLQLALQAELAAWETDLEIQRRKENPSTQWVVYRQGGRDALENLLDFIKNVPAEENEIPSGE